MNFKKLSLLLIQSCLLFMVCTASSEPVHAAEKRNAPMRIVVSVNDLSQMTTIKEALINSLVDYNAYPELVDNINYEASELKTASLDLTQTGTQRTAIYLRIKPNKALSENTLYKNTITTTVDFEVKDMQAPVITSEVNTLRRSINSELDPYQHLSVSDNFDEEVQIQYETDIDLQTAGEYTITYTATDKAGNSSVLSLPIIVASQRYTNYEKDQSYANEMLNLINEYRASYGLEPYRMAPYNAQMAAGVRACEARSYLSHERPDGRHYKTAFNEYGVQYSSPYEILTFAGTTAADGLAWWKQSSSHNAYILSETSTVISIGYCDGLWAAIVYND